MTRETPNYKTLNNNQWIDIFSEQIPNDAKTVWIEKHRNDIVCWYSFLSNDEAWKIKQTAGSFNTVEESFFMVKNQLTAFRKMSKYLNLMIGNIVFPISKKLLTQT
jgi:hypothetical protein